MARIPLMSRWPAAVGSPTWPIRMLLSAPAVGVCSVAFTAGTIRPTIVPRKTARVRPVTARKARFGLSASRRLASSADDPLADRPKSRAACAVSHGPAITRPIIVSRIPG